MKRDKASCDQMQLHVLEAGEQGANVVRREHLQMRRVVLGLLPEQETQPVLQPVGVRNGGDERSSGSEHAEYLADDAPWIAKVLEELAGDDDVEGAVGEGKRIVEVGPARLDSELVGLGESLAIGVDADDLVPAGVGLREGAVTAAEIENIPPGAADVAAKEIDPFGTCEDEAGAALDAVVLGIPFAQLLQAHRLRA